MQVCLWPDFAILRRFANGGFTSEIILQGSHYGARRALIGSTIA